MDLAVAVTLHRLDAQVESHGDRYAGPDEGRLTVTDLLDALERNLELRRRSVRSFRPHITAMRKQFGMIRALDMTPIVIERDQQDELNAPTPRATRPSTARWDACVPRFGWRTSAGSSRACPTSPCCPRTTPG